MALDVFRFDFLGGLGVHLSLDVPVIRWSVVLLWLWTYVNFHFLGNWWYYNDFTFTFGYFRKSSIVISRL